MFDTTITTVWNWMSDNIIQLPDPRPTAMVKSAGRGRPATKSAASKAKASADVVTASPGARKTRTRAVATPGPAGPSGPSVGAPTPQASEWPATAPVINGNAVPGEMLFGMRNASVSFVLKSCLEALF